jgi:hypothetical protein
MLYFYYMYLIINFYSSDQYPGHPDAVNSMVAATDNVLITACEDGIIRAVHLFPHRFIGQVAIFLSSSVGLRIRIRSGSGSEVDPNQIKEGKNYQQK